jgi:hypothetical protein
MNTFLMASPMFLVQRKEHSLSAGRGQKRQPILIAAMKAAAAQKWV